MSALDSPTRPRWWPLIAILVVVAALLLWTWWDPESDDRQSQVMASEGILSGATLALALWLILLSRVAVRVKGMVAMAVALLIGLFFAGFRYDGVDGDLVPVFTWRWLKVETVVTGEPLSGVAVDWPQFRGVLRNGEVAGVDLADDWDAAPPKLVWRRPVGGGWAGFAVAGERAVTLEQHGDQERVTCYALGNGDLLWSTSTATEYRNKLAGDGPRTTPTIDAGRVYTAGATGIVSAIELRTGTRLWTRDLIKEFDGKIPAWGFSASPLVVDGMIIVGSTATEPSMVALDAATGEPRWSAGDDVMGYASAELATLAGKRQIVAFNHGSAVGHDVATGKVLWSYPWRDRQPNCAQPLPIGENRLLLSSGYAVGSHLIELTPSGDDVFTASRIWRSSRMKAKFSSMIFHDGAVFGLDDGALACIDASTGKRLWKSGRYGHGQIIRVGDHMLISEEMGAVALVALDRSRYRELTRFQVFDRKTWNPPTLAGSRLLMRNDREAALYLLPRKP